MVVPLYRWMVSWKIPSSKMDDEDRGTRYSETSICWWFWEHHLWMIGLMVATTFMCFFSCWWMVILLVVSMALHGWNRVVFMIKWGWHIVICFFSWWLWYRFLIAGNNFWLKWCEQPRANCQSTTMMKWSNRRESNLTAYICESRAHRWRDCTSGRIWACPVDGCCRERIWTMYSIQI